jgi:hypothetical protein
LETPKLFDQEWQRLLFQRVIGHRGEVLFCYLFYFLFFLCASLMTSGGAETEFNKYLYHIYIPLLKKKSGFDMAACTCLCLASKIK